MAWGARFNFLWIEPVSIHNSSWGKNLTNEQVAGSEVHVFEHVIALTRREPMQHGRSKSRGGAMHMVPL